MALFLAFSFLSLLLLISPTCSLKCTSQTFTNNKLYKNCTDLPTLSASLHWTYQSTNSSLSIAFLAPPAKSNGWIAWAINPTGTGMVGAQSLIAFKQPNGSITVKTYNISSYNSIVESKLSFDVPEASAEYSGGVMKIFATLALPVSLKQVNHVWQVGGSVSNGMPEVHAFKSGNLGAKGVLNLGVNGTPVGSPSVAPSPSIGGRVSEGPNSGNNGTGGSTRMESNFGVHVFLMFLGGLLIFWS